MIRTVEILKVEEQTHDLAAVWNKSTGISENTVIIQMFEEY